jgi:hypothetical protein
MDARQLQHLADIEDIKTLKYWYCRHNDGGWAEQGPSHMGPCAELFVEDAVWDGGPAGYAEGREAIAKLFVQLRALKLAFHAVLNPIIEVDGDTATGHWHLIGGAETPDGESSLALGGYEEEYVRTPDGWRFKSMKVIWARRAVVPGGWLASLPIPEAA